MKKTLGSLIVSLGFDGRKVDQGLKQMERDLKRTGANLQRIGRDLSIGLTAPIVGFGVAAIKAASDAEETFSKFGVVFRNVSKEAERSFKTLRNEYGLSGKAAKQMLGDTGDLLTGFGFSQEAALDLSTQVNKLAVDLASFTNYSGGAKGASEALTKALLGERESVKQLGIAILEEDVKARVALLNKQGITFETERQAKAYATLQIAMEQSKNAIGDYARTSDSFANQWKLLRAQIEDLTVELGTMLLPIAKKLVAWAQEQIAKFRGLSTETKELIIKVAGLAALAGPLTILAGTVLKLAGTFITLSANIDKVGRSKMGIIGIALAVKELLTSLNNLMGSNAMKKFMEGGSVLEYRATKFNETFNNVMLGNFGKAVKSGKEALAGPQIPNSSSFGTNYSLIPGFVPPDVGILAPPSSTAGGKSKGSGGGGGGVSKSTGGPFEYVETYSNQLFEQFSTPEDNPMLKAMAQLGRAGGGSIGSIAGRGLDASGIGGIMPDLGAEEIRKQTQALRESMGFWRDWGGSVVDAIGMLGGALADGEGFLKAFAKTALSTANQVIQAEIGKIIASIVAGEAKKGFVGALLGLAGAGVVVGLLTSQISKSKAPALADGGLAYGPTMATVGDNPNAGIDPEVIAPLSKLKSMMQGVGTGMIQVEGIIRGDDILLTTSKAQDYANRRGSGNAIKF